MDKRRTVTGLLVTALIVGTVLLLYPVAADYWNRKHQTVAIASYAEAAESLGQDDYDRLWRQAAEFNSSILKRDNQYALSSKEREEYNRALDVSGTGIMGYVEIPSIGVSLPIYHGTDDSVLQIATGHLDWTSLPTGGEGTHCVISGHRGLPSARIFTDLNKVVVGDIFMIRVLDQTFTYEVDQILTVSPSDTKALKIERDRDLCTLVTCTPYGVNTERLLVRGHRTENSEISKTVRVTADAVQIEPVVVAPFAAIPLLMAFILWILV